MSDLPRETHLCPECDRALSREHFPALPEDRRCVYCIATADLREDKERQTELAKDIMAEVLDEASAPAIKPARIEELCAEIVDFFGGMRLFVRRWGREFEEALRRHPGKTGNLNHFVQIAKLINEANKRQHAKDVADMSDEQIRREQELIMMEMLTKAAMDKKRAEAMRRLLEASNITINPRIEEVIDED